MRRFFALVVSLYALCGICTAASVKKVLPDSVLHDRDSLFIESFRFKYTGQADSAYMVLAKADSIDPNNAAVCYELGSSLVATDFTSAFQYLKRAAELSPDNYYYQKALIRAYIALNDYNSAIKGYEALVKKYPDHEGDLYMLAELYVRTKNFKAAIKTLEKLERLTGVDSYVSMSKVEVYKMAGDVKSAHKTLDRIIKEMPQNSSLWVFKGDLYLASNDMEEAYECYQKSMEMEPDNGEALESLYMYYVRTGETDKIQECSCRIFASSDIQFKRKKEYLNQTVRYFTATRTPLAELDTIYRSMIEAEADNADIRLMYADYLMNMSRSQDAIEELRSAVYVNPQCKECWEYLLYQVAQSNDSIMIEKVLSDAMDAIPESADFYYYSGIWNYSKGVTDKALDYMLKADSIVTVSEKSLSDSNKKELWNYLFNYYYQKGDNEKKYLYLDKSVAAFPNDLMGLNNYAYILAEDNADLDKAEAMSKKTVEKEPLQSLYLDTYAYILMKKGQLTYAKFYIEQALEYMKSNPDAIIIEHYGDILFKLGDVNGALEQWKRSYGMEREGADKEKLKLKIETKQYVE